MRLAPGLIVAASLLSTGALADLTPPAPISEPACSNGIVYDPKVKKCVPPQESQLSQHRLLLAANAYAQGGAYRAAQSVLEAMHDQTDDRVLTLWGYTHRQLGHWELGMAYYDRALGQNPDNILARSYLGQALVQIGDLSGALGELRQIQARGGAGSSAEANLQAAILAQTAYRGG